MHRLRNTIVIWLLSSTLILCSYGQSFPQPSPQSVTAQNIPKAPDTGVRDSTDLFRHQPDAIKRISTQIQKLKKNHGYHIYLVIEPILISTTTSELATRLQQSWLPDGNGLVIVYESDTRAIGLGRNIGNPAPDENIHQIPTHETEAILMDVTSSIDQSLTPQAYIEALTTTLAFEFNDYFEQLNEPPPEGRPLRFFLLTIGGITLLALGVMAAAFVSKLPSMKKNQTFRFPEVDRPERLGAPYGGGDIAARRFAMKPESKKTNQSS